MRIYKCKGSIGNHSQHLSLLAFQSATSEAWPDTVSTSTLWPSCCSLDTAPSLTHLTNTTLPPVHPALFRTECLYADLLHSNILQSIWISLLLIWSSMQLLVTVKKNRELQSLFLFRYEEPRDILQAFRHSISLHHSGIEPTLCRLRAIFSFSWPLFLFHSTLSTIL